MGGFPLNPQDRKFLDVFTMVLGVLVGITVILFALARHSGSVQYDWLVQDVLAEEQSVEYAAQEYVAQIAAVVADSAAETPDAATPEQQAAASVAPENWLEDPEWLELGFNVLVNDGCGSCHGSGWDNAPRIGALEMWEHRLPQGRETLHRHAIEGIGGMPAKGSSEYLSDDEVRAAVDRMLAELPLSHDDLLALLSPPSLETAAAEEVGRLVYERACNVCHVAGNLIGAPGLGDAAAWEARVAQGVDVLYERALSGFVGARGFMPARGTDPNLSDDEVRAAVDYMLQQLP